MSKITHIKVFHSAATHSNREKVKVLTKEQKIK